MMKLLELLTNKGLNINLDSDGILSYLLLKKCLKDTKIVGFNNSDHYIWSTRNKFENTNNDIFIDIFLPKKDVICIDQHVISTMPEDLIEFKENKLNPHLLIEQHHALNSSYMTKFPFQTFLFIMAMIERENNKINGIDYYAKIPNIENDILFIDFILRGDGVLENYVKYKPNITNWSKKLLSFSNNGTNTKLILDYLFNLSDDEALNKTKTISDFYLKYNLAKDGGYNTKFGFIDNLKIINMFMRSYANYIGVDLEKRIETIYQYNGQTHIFKNDTLPLINLSRLDTYAFVANDRLSCTTNIRYNKRFTDVTFYN